MTSHSPRLLAWLAICVFLSGCGAGATSSGDAEGDAVSRDARDGGAPDTAFDTGGDAAVDSGSGEGACADVGCPASPAPCVPNVCDEAAGRCVATPLPAGTPCERDDDPCTIDACDARGLCAYSAYDEGAPGCAGPDCLAFEVCDNDRDDDCDGATDCGDGSCAADAACGAACDAPLATLSCGDLAPPVDATTGVVGAYACAGVPSMPGSEAVYAFVPGEDGLMRVTVNAEPAVYTWVLLLADTCAGAHCAAATWLGGPDDTLIAAVTGGVPYYVVVDASVGGVLAVAGVWLECSAGEVCDNEADDDWDALADCADPDCRGGPPCEPTEATCADGFDNDADGWTDCADADCHGVGPCEAEESDCTDGFDNDADGATDCADEACLPSPACVTSCEDAVRSIACGWSVDALSVTTQSFPEHPCVEGSWLMPDLVLAFEAEATGLVRLDLLHTHPELLVEVLRGDCVSTTCVATGHPEPHHVVRAVEFAVEAGERYVIVADATAPLGAPLSLASVTLTCGAPEVCDDGADNDLDGATDCADDECADLGAPCESAEASCADGFDNDADGATDCGDPDCGAVSPPCEHAEARCDDAFDNDGDGTTDCDDPDCATAEGCGATCTGAPILIDCGYQATLDGDAPETGSLPTNACLGIATPGGELVYAFTPTADVDIVFEVFGAEANGYVVVTLHEGACAVDTCVAWPDPAGDRGTITASLTAGTPYYFILDSTWPGAPGGDRVRLTCLPGR